MRKKDTGCRELTTFFLIEGTIIKVKKLHRTVVIKHNGLELNQSNRIFKKYSNSLQKFS